MTEIDKNRFFEKIHYTPHAKQKEIHDCDARFRLAACGVRFGKSYSGAAEALAMMPYKDTRGWIIAPTYDLTEKVFREVYSWAANYLKEWIAEESYSRKYIRFITGSEIYCKSADNPISLSGESLDFIIWDEAPACKEEIWTHYLRERITDRKGWVLFIGTPRGRSWYYHIFLKGQDPLETEYKSFHYTTADNPYIDPNEIKSAQVQIPDRAFRQEYLAEFLSDTDAVFRHIRERIRNCLKPPESGKSYVGGVDLAKYQDYNVVIIADRDTHEIVYYDRWNRTDWTITYDRIAAASRKYNCPMTIDSTGIGDPIFETLKKPPYSLPVKPYKFTNATKEILIDNLVWYFENANIWIPEIPEMINELEIFEYETTKPGNTTFNAPEGYHDDIVIGLALAAQGFSRKGFISDSFNLKDL